MFRKPFAAGSVLLFSAQALSHEGHDHSHWSASTIHLLTYAAIVGAAAVLSYVLYKKFRQPTKQQ